MILLLIPFLLLPLFGNMQPQAQTLVTHAFPLTNRYADTVVNDVFKDNILLTLVYTTGEKVDPKRIDWQKIEKPFEYKFVLKPGETFAFHDDVLPKYVGKVNKTTNSHFNYQEGFKSDGYLYGDGVCHLASLLYWVAKDAGLDVLAPTRHDFMPIPDIPREFGVSIYNYPDKSVSDQKQNLYITNNKEKDVVFAFSYYGNNLTITALEL